MWKELVEKM